VSKVQGNLQDSFLNLVRKENIPVTVFLVNGYQLKGYIRGFDNFTVAVEFEGKVQLVYKHALSTIQPVRPLPVTIAQLMAGGAAQEPESD